METKILFFSTLTFIVLSFSSVRSQTYVNTQPADKNVILEEFTGVRCPNCPDGHAVAQAIVQNNPGRAWLIGFHPYNSSYTEPYGNDPDFRRHHPDSLYMIPYCGTSRYMPSAFINRRVYNGERLQGRDVWAAKTAEHLAEPSPVNVGLNTSYNESTHQLDVLVEVYFTGDVADVTTINVLFTESGMIAQQAGGSTNYVHKHVFREVFTAQWGDPIDPASQGTFLQFNYVFDNSAQAYDMEECEVIAYIVNDNTDEVISGIGCEVGDNTNFSPPVADFIADSTEIYFGGSVDFTDLSTGIPTSWEWSFEGGTPSTSALQNPEDIVYDTPGVYGVTLTATNANGSDVETKTGYITVHYTSSVDDRNKGNIMVYPVPSPGLVTVESFIDVTEPFDIIISDMNGLRKASFLKLSGNRNLLNLGFLDSGKYLLTINFAGGSKTFEIMIIR